MTPKLNTEDLEYYIIFIIIVMFESSPIANQ